jgi:lysophospholipase L1-like esterase
VNKKLKIFSLIFISLILTCIVCLFCRYIASHYFFDKFYFEKSFRYGYWIPNDKNPLYQNFGSRAKDIMDLNKNISIPIDNKKYNIAIFGDSYVWGQGVLKNQRFPVLLEKQLNKIRPTKVYSFGNSGDNLFENYMKYQMVLKNYGHMDLYIFQFFNNDLVFNTDKHYNTDQFLTELTKNCSGNTIYDPEYNSNNPNQRDQFIESKKSSLDHNSVNYCAYKKLLPLLPKENTIYIDFGNMIENWNVQTSFSTIIDADLNVIEPPYLPICQSNPLVCYVSNNDSHPSAFIHQKYTDILFKEITSNQKWNFRNQ